MSDMGYNRDWQCIACGACGTAPSEQQIWMIECDDCRRGAVVWANDAFEDRGFTIHSGGDGPLDAPSVIGVGAFREF
jgi:hypothetical protein